MATKPKAGLKKSELIRAMLARGMTSPTEVSARIKAEHGLEIDPAYVSVIKSLRRSRKRPRAEAVARDPQRDTQKLTMVFVLKNGGSIEAARSALEGMRENPAMAFAISLGGVDAAIRALRELENHLTK